MADTMRLHSSRNHREWSKGWRRASTRPRQSRTSASGLLYLLDDGFSLPAQRSSRIGVPA
jgi:hypothetical protein